MRIRYRLILSFLVMAMIPLFLIVIQANLALNQQRNLVNDRITQVLDTVSDETKNLNREEIATSLNEGQIIFDKEMKSAQFGLVFWGFLFAAVMAGMGILLAVKFASPVEMLFGTAYRTLQVVQSLSAGDSTAAVNGTSTIESITNDIKPSPRNEEKLISYTFGILETRIKDEFTNLEMQVRSRTDEFKQLSDRLLDVEKIVHESVETLDVNRLLREAVQQISQRFGFYHVGIYLLDESRQYAELKAVAGVSVDGQENLNSGTGRQRMLEKDYRLKVGDGKSQREDENHREGEEQGEGIPGYVAATGEVYQSADISQDAHALPSPDLPSARSEVALPLRTGGAVIGVLDVQSTRLTKFTTEEIAILHVLADQLALAVENARLLEQARLAQGAERRGVWRDYTPGLG